MSFFRVKQTRDRLGRRRWHWALVDNNGEIIADHELYNSKRACLDAVDNVKREAAGATIRFVS
jgi:uncharacterized protein YegP (UPF0339 family)